MKREQDHEKKEVPSDLNYETEQLKASPDAAAGKTDMGDAKHQPPKKDDSSTHSSTEPMGPDIPKDGSMPRY